MSDQDEMLSTDIVAERLGVTPRTVQRWCKAGKLPGARQLFPGSQRSPYIIPLSAVRAYERRLAETSNGDKPN